MNIVTVLPITNGRIDNELKYFSNMPVKVGSIVTIPIRKKEVIGIINNVESASDIKSNLRNLDYKLKKLSKINSNDAFPKYTIDIARNISDHYVTSTGSVLHSAIATEIFSANWPQDIHDSSKRKLIPEIFAIQGDDEDRMSLWKTIIRQEFAKKKSLVFFAPTVEEAKKLFSCISKGIEDYAYILDGSDSNRNFKMKWDNIIKNVHPIIVIATPTFSLIPRNDISTVIIERENHSNWITDRNPYLNTKLFIEKTSIDQDRTLYIGDKCLTIETLYRVELHDIQMGPLFKWRLVSKAEDIFVDMKEQQSKTFSIISNELDLIIKKNKAENSHLFVYTLRKGYSSITICDDCGTIFSCKECESPLVLHQDEKNQRNFYLCHKCGEKAGAQDVCKKCLGTNLSILGIGLERVAEEIRSKHPGTELFVLDPMKIKTEKMKESLINQFIASPGSILLGTESALSKINQEIDFTAIVSIDSLFSIPDFRISEKIMSILTKLRSITRNKFIIQTRQSRERIFEYGRKGNISDYYKNVIDDRKISMFPPFSTLLKITIRGNKEKIAQKMAMIKELVSPDEIDVFPVYTKETQNRYAIHGLIKMPRGYWPNSELISKLRTLERDVEIKINPENLL